MNYSNLYEHELNQKGIENFIVLILGTGKKNISLLHLEKEIFLLWNFHPMIKKFLDFIEHYRGPFSKEIQETVLYPFYLEDCWKYIPPKKGDSLSGGYVELTEKGIREYNRLLDNIGADEDLKHLLSGMKIVRQLYDKLTLEELLLLIYDTYPEFTKKSNVYDQIKKKKEKISTSLMKKGLIDEKRKESFFSGVQ